MQEDEKYYKTLKTEEVSRVELYYGFDLYPCFEASLRTARERIKASNVMRFVQTAHREAPIRRPPWIPARGRIVTMRWLRRHDGLWPLFLLEYRDHVLQKAVELRRVAAVSLCLAAIAILAAACDGNRATQTPVDTPAPTNAPTPPEVPTPTDTPLPAETPTPTKLPAPTDTSVPTLAPTPTIEVHPTATPTADALAGFSPPDPVPTVLGTYKRRSWAGGSSGLRWREHRRSGREGL